MNEDIFSGEGFNDDDFFQTLDELTNQYIDIVNSDEPGKEEALKMYSLIGELL